MTDEEFQELKRENFNLKLRIYFLEENNQFSPNTNEYQTETFNIQQSQNEIERLQQRIQSQPAQTDNRKTVYNFDYDDERRALREELEKFRQENALLRKSFQLNSNQTHGDKQEKSIIKTPAVSQNIQTLNSTDSGFNTTTVGMSNTFLSSSALQIELNEYKERERKLQEQVNSLRKQLETSLPQTNETLAELDRARRRIQQYESDIKNYEQQQSKSERVLQRLQADYEARIATLVEQQQKQIVDFETYRHEPDETSPNVNIEEYRQAINDRNRIIQQLEEAINEITVRLRTPFTLMLPSHSSTSEWTDEHSQNLIRELNTQMQAHLETVDQLRAECVELRRSEKNLRNQVESLTQLINAPNRNLGLPPLPRPSTSSSKTVDTFEDARQVQDLQTVVVQITLQLQSDAENVSGLTNRVAQMIRDRDEWNDKLNRLHDEIEKKNVHIRQLEKREPEVESRIRQQFVLQIEALQRDIRSLQEELNNRDRLLYELKNEKKEIQTKTRKDYERFDQINAQERTNLQGQLRTANENLMNLQQQLVEEHTQNDDLRRKYEKIQQRKLIENLNFDIRETETKFQNERRQLERDRDFEKEKHIELQNALNLTNRRFSELQTEYDRERTHTNDEIQNLRRENQAIKDRYRDVDNKMFELTKRNDEEFQHARSSYEPKDLHLDLEIEIEQLEHDIETQEHFIRTYTETSPQRRDQQFERLPDNTRQVHSIDNTSVIGTLQGQYIIRDRRSEQALNENTLTINEYERRISELQTVIREKEHEILNIDAKLQQTEQTLNTQQHELDTCRQKRDILNVDLNIAIEENETYLDKIKTLEKQLEMSHLRNISSEQNAQYQNIIDDLKARLRNQEDTIQNLQRTISDSDRTLRETRQTHQSIQSDYNRAQLRYEQMENQYKADLENRDQTIASLRKKVADTDQEIKRLRESDIAKEAVISKLRSKSRESNEESRSEYSGARAPTNVGLRLELQKKDDQIDELKRQLERARRDISSSGRDDSSTVQHAQRVEVHRRPRLTSFDHLNREELLYELEMALQDNEGLVQQLAKLARQKYVNQVLWRKLDALIDIQGSNTRAELAIELANYHDELEALKAKQHRVNDTRLAMLNASSRSSSGVCLVIRYCLIDSSSIRQRRYSDEDCNRELSTFINMVTSNEKMDHSYDTKNIEELQEIIRNQKKYIEQLQIRIRINAPDIIQSTTLQQLTEQNKNLNLVIQTYKNESNILKNALEKLNKTSECNRITLQQYQNLIKKQQNYIEQINKKSNQYEQLSKVC
ncbi:unnamed protein product [Rotaria sp. Silwood2]|nr:unnamed protein product [Rotaria sp. Silwood2]